MPLARGDKEAQLPILGLNTEASPLTFPENAFVDGLNVELGYDPLRIQRRRGLSNTRGNTSTTLIDQGVDPLLATAYLWEAVAGNPEDNIYVIQIGASLVFHDADVDNPTTAPFAVAFDLNTNNPSTVPLRAENFRCEFTNVKGALLVCNPAINPLLVQFNVNDNTNPFDFREIKIKIRDFLGVSDGLGTDQRTTVTPLTDEHRYNLYNQGWHQKRPALDATNSYNPDGVDPIDVFFTKIGAYPSNADISYIGMVPYENINDALDPNTGRLYFNPEIVRDIAFGSTPAPRGHYIVDAFAIDRAAILLSPYSFEFTGQVLANPDPVPPPIEETPPESTDPEPDDTGTAGGSGGSESGSDPIIIDDKPPPKGGYPY